MRHAMLMLCWLIPSLAAANALKGNDSAYLAMHGDDPVDWQPWSAAVLAQAQRENKLLFVSSGYFACHWCHVMQRESFQNPAVAAVLNTHFIAVKVDRELHPALDAYLIDFVTRTRGSAGWPLNVFLTPAGHPLVGMSYVSVETFVSLLQDLQRQWQQGGDYLKATAAQAAAQLRAEQRTDEPPLDQAKVAAYEALLVKQALQLGDVMEGGFGEQSKFPMVPHMTALLAAYERHPTPPLKEFLTRSLDQMQGQGLRDHLGGGFFRYTVDPGWQVPHFEKMLYDNALLASLYLRAARVLARPDYQAVARETLDFMLREMATPAGGMLASLSAVDAAGVEGGYYLWPAPTLSRLLTADELAVVQRVWGLQGPGALEAGYLPRTRESLPEVAAGLGMGVAQATRRLDAARRKLLAARSQRSLPRDTKILASWNGLALLALVEGAQQTGDKRYARAARQVRDYVLNNLWDGRRLLRARGKAGELGTAGLEDYAFVAEGLWAWAAYRGETGDAQLAQRLVAAAWQRFHDDSGWLLSDQTLLPTGFGVPLLEEGPLPSPAVSLLRTTARLAEERPAWEPRLQAALPAGHTQLARAAFDFPGQVALLAQRYLGGARQAGP